VQVTDCVSKPDFFQAHYPKDPTGARSAILRAEAGAHRSTARRHCCGQKWLQQLIPFFTERERRSAGVEHRLFFSQVELCDNLIFSRRAALDRMADRLMDANRTIGQPNKLTVIFGRKITKRYNGKLQTVIEDMNARNRRNLNASRKSSRMFI
jgi:hypothetical protein